MAACYLAEEYGESAAVAAGEVWEMWTGGGSDAESDMDRDNNAVGASKGADGSTPLTCHSKCMGALQSGELTVLH